MSAPTSVHPLALLIGQRLARLRQAKGLTQAQLAQQVGYSHSSIAYIEAGLSFPALDQTMALANVLGVHPDELLNVGERERLLVAPRLISRLLVLTQGDGGRFLADLETLVELLRALPQQASAGRL